MTRKELYAEIKRIDGFIEVLQGFLKKPLCKCISNAKNINSTFTEENKKHLLLLINIRNFLLPLQGEPDAVLAKIDYRPIVFSC